MNVVSVRSTTTCVRPVVDRRGHALLELRGGEEVDLAGDGDDVGVVVDRPVFDRESHGHRGGIPGAAIPIQAERLVAAPAYSRRTCRNSALALGRHAELVGELLDDVADARHRGVDDQRVAAAGAERADAQRQRARAGLEGHVDGRRAARARARGRRSGRRPGRRRRGGRAAGRRGRRACPRRGAGSGRRAGRRRSRRVVGASTPTGSQRHAASPRRVPGERHRHSAATARDGLELDLVGDRGDQRQAEARARVSELVPMPRP